MRLFKMWNIASKSKIIKSVIDFANSGGLVLGICNGFQILTETGLLPEFFSKINISNLFVKISLLKLKIKK